MDSIIVTMTGKAGQPPGDSARVGAERAIHEFQGMLFDLDEAQVKDAYARLVVGRGFQKSRREQV